MGILKKLSVAFATCASLTACGDMSPQEGALLGAGLGGILADEAGINRNDGRLIGSALGSNIAANQGYCEGTTYITREARRDNTTGATVYDTTRQTQSERCTQRGGQGPQRIF